MWVKIKKGLKGDNFMDNEKANDIKEMSNICYGNIENGVKKFMDKELIYISQLRKDIATLTQDDSKLQAMLDSILAPIQSHMIDTYNELYKKKESKDE